MRAVALAATVVTMLAALSGCSSSSAATSSPTPSPSPAPIVHIGEGATHLGTAAAQVKVEDGSFVYKGSGVNPEVDVKVGDIVEWAWMEQDPTTVHNVTFATLPALLDNLDPQASSPRQVGGVGATWQVHFIKAGTWGFVCTLHSGVMTGTVVVSP